jgi:putative transposase
MDGRGRWVDNVFIKRLWKSVKYEEVSLKAYDSISIARKSLKEYFDFYNQRRWRQNLERKTPDEVYWSTLEHKEAA